MAEIKIPNIRTEGDVRLYVRLSDNGVAVNWNSLSSIRAWLFSEEQQLVAGEGAVSVSAEDGEVLVVDYRVSEAQYLGVQRLVVSGVYDGRVKTYDKLALNFVPTTAMATGQTVIDDPTVSVDIEASEETAGVNIEVNEVSTSMLDAAIEAALGAAVKADESAAAADAAALAATSAAADARTAADDAREAVKDLPTKEEFEKLIEGKQERLISGENIKTINGQDILGEGDIEIKGGGGGGFEPTDEQLNAMDSGITADKVSQYDAYATSKQDAIDDLATIRSNAAASVQTSGDQRIEGRKIFSDLRVVEDTLDENILFEAEYEAESDLLRLNINDTYDGESVILGHVGDPINDFDAVNKQTLEAEIAKVQPGKTYAFAISPEMYDIEFDPTKGVAPYNPSYGYTNITIHEDEGVEWVEGGIYTIMVRENVSNTYRNGRVRIGVNGAWYPLVTVATNQVITASNVLNVNQTTVMVFKKNAYPEGALHCLYVTTYSLITQAEINAGTSTAARLISPQLLMENYGSKIAALETRYAEDAALLEYANEVTGAGDTDLGEAVRTLAAGYGGGGEKPWKLVADYEKSDTVKDVFTTFADGTPLDVEEILMYASWGNAFASASSGYIAVWLEQVENYVSYGPVSFGTTNANRMSMIRVNAKEPLISAMVVTNLGLNVGAATAAQISYGGVASPAIPGPFTSERITRIQVRPNAMSGTSHVRIYAR